MRLDPEMVASWFVASAAEAAERLGVFAALASPRTIDELATELQTSARIAALIDLLVGAGRLVREGERVRAGTSGPRDARGATLIAEVIRRGHPYAPAHDTAELQRDARHLDVRPLLSLGAIASALVAIDRAPQHAVFLDAGGGLGDATRWFLARSTGRAILVDTEPVIEAARRHLAEHAARITFVAADLRSTELPRCDLAFLSNVLHLHPEPACEAIVGAVVRAVDPGGTVALKDVALEDDRAGPLPSLAVGLVCQIFGDGRVHTSSHLANYLRRLGMQQVKCERLSGLESALVTGRIE